MIVPDLKSIPDEVKWKLASQCASRMPALYDAVFRPVLQARYDELDQKIWMELARLSVETARSLELPLGDAREVAESLRTVTAIQFGPDYRGEVIEVGDDGAVVLVKHCPFLVEGAGNAIAGNGIFHRCMAFTLTFQKRLNPGYASRYVRAMCMGDRQCEIKVEAVNGKEPKNQE